MKWLFTSLIVLLAAVSLALVANQDTGYVLLARQPWTVEMSLSLFVLLLVVGFVVLYLVVRFLLQLWSLPGNMSGWRGRYRLRRARASSRRGQIELAEGRWAEAERHLVRYADYSDSPLVNYLSAARAAQKQHAYDRRDHYLLLAHHSGKDSDLAVGLTQAELQLVQGQYEQSLATLMHLRSTAPKHSYALFLLARLYREMKSWGDLYELLPELRRRKVFDKVALQEMEREVHAALLDIAIRSGNISRLKEAWQRLPKAMRMEEALVLRYARTLAEKGQGAEVESVLRDAIKQRWSDCLVHLYGMVKGDDVAHQLSMAEGWLVGRERDATLLLTLGRLCLHNQLWGKARSYFEGSVGVEPRIETYRELGLLLEQLGEEDKAMDCYRKGMQRALDSECSPFQVSDEERAACAARPPMSQENQSPAISKASE